MTGRASWTMEQRPMREEDEGPDGEADDGEQGLDSREQGPDDKERGADGRE